VDDAVLPEQKADLKVHGVPRHRDPAGWPPAGSRAVHKLVDEFPVPTLDADHHTCSLIEAKVIRWRCVENTVRPMQILDLLQRIAQRRAKCRRPRLRLL